MQFTEHFGINRSSDDDWFDVLLPADTNLFVDPFLIYDDMDPFWVPAHEYVLNFFGMVFGLVRDSKGNELSLSLRQAKRLLLFPEPSEFCLGLAATSPLGSGAGNGLQVGMLEGVRTALGLGIDNVPHIDMLALFQGGMGVDRISDAICNILKSKFIDYTQRVCRRHNIPMVRTRVRNADWSESGARWIEREVELPTNPYTRRPQAVLLVPERFLKDIPIVTADRFWTYAFRTHSSELRGDFNWDIASNVDRMEKARLARRNPEVVAAYLEHVEQQPREPYDLVNDPKMRVRWWPEGGDIAKRSPLGFVPTRPDEFPKFVESMITAFQHGIEQQDCWKLLWESTGRSVDEKKAQALFRSTMIHYCRANDIDLTGESDAGRGPVDFKFSQGWCARALVEIKLMRNSKFWDGILAQEPQYLISEEVRMGYFVAMAYDDDEMDPLRVDKVHRAAAVASKHNSDIEVRPMVIDARQKNSASDLKPSQEMRDEIHRRNSKNEIGSDPELS
ncbi:MAG TPA: hypothetical protein VFR11_12430 [Micromonosporaceae bacterium]|nr:hypothetical protein [Micromonosporaceae bacterium]